MGADQTRWAIVQSDGRVVTFLRMDLPDQFEVPSGCTIVPDDELPAGWQEARDVPAQVSPRQIRLWLVANGYSMATVNAAIESIEDQAMRDAVAIEWEYAPWVERAHPMIEPLAMVLGLTVAQVDAAFIEAALL